MLDIPEPEHLENMYARFPDGFVAKYGTLMSTDCEKNEAFAVMHGTPEIVYIAPK